MTLETTEDTSAMLSDIAHEALRQAVIDAAEDYRSAYALRKGRFGNFMPGPSERNEAREALFAALDALEAETA